MRLLERAGRLIAAIAVTVSFGAASALAGAPFSFADTPGKLPKTVVPVHYTLDLKPDLDRLTVTGSQVVEIDVKAPTDRLLLNTVRTTFASAVVDGIGTATVSFDPGEKSATLTFTRELGVGRHTVRIAFTSQINQRPGGPFRIEYRRGLLRKRIFSTHLQPNEARELFPSWDEPSFKATFDLTVTVPRSFLAVSNMPVASEQPIAGNLKRVTFQRTPVMPTYIFALITGELERTTLDVDGITLGVVALPGKQAEARFALENGAALLRFFNDYTGFKYPLPKLDLLALPRPAGEAHENWGAITFNEDRLLVGSSMQPSARRSIFRLVAHEMAHQWFGNLVTMAWWDNVWLNEAVATWIETKAPEQLQPEWPNWLTAASSKQRAMAADAAKSAYPVHRKVDTDREMNAMFDVMTYNKGAAVVRMLESYLGEHAFRDGVRRYLARHAYSNTMPADLWRALEEASGKSVEPLAAAYIERVGIPLIIAEGACVDGRQRMRLTQDRFTIRNPDAEPQRWQVPIVLGPAAGEPRPEVTVLDGTGEIAAGACDEVVKLNVGNSGYYRVEYDATTHTKLAKAIAAMSPADRINLLADTWALVEAGRKPLAAYTELVGNLPADDDHSVWERIVRYAVRSEERGKRRDGRAPREE